MSKPFRFKKFEVAQDATLMKVGTDSVLLGAWIEVGEAQNALDIGAGSGILSLMLAQKMAEKAALEKAVFQIDAVEIDGPSAAQARTNFEKSDWAERLAVVESSIQDFARTTSKSYDLIVSNPPFFTGGNFVLGPTANSARHNFQLPSGDLLAAVRRLLSADGCFCLVLPHLEGLRFSEMAAQYGLYLTRQMDVFTRAERPVERVLLQLEKKPFEYHRDSITIYDGTVFSKKYGALTGTFYLDF